MDKGDVQDELSVSDRRSAMIYTVVRIWASGKGRNLKHTSSSTPESTPPSVNRSSHVLMTLGADSGSTRFTPTTLVSEILPAPIHCFETYLSRSICGHRLALAPAPAETLSRTEVATELFKSSTVRSSAQLILILIVVCSLSIICTEGMRGTRHGCVGK